MTPQIGDIVHYVSHGTPIRAGGDQIYPSACRAAVVTAVDRYQPGVDGEFIGHVDLAVFNPTGMFFNRGVHFHPGDPAETGARCEQGNRAYPGGTWHRPERDGQ